MPPLKARPQAERRFDNARILCCGAANLPDKCCNAEIMPDWPAPAHRKSVTSCFPEKVSFHDLCSRGMSMSRLALLLAAALSLPQVAAGACAPVFADADAAVEFRQTITAYYDCDRISRGRMLSAAEAAACSHLYEATKSYFPAEDGQSLMWPSSAGSWRTPILSPPSARWSLPAAKAD